MWSFILAAKEKIYLKTVIIKKMLSCLLILCNYDDLVELKN